MARALCSIVLALVAVASVNAGSRYAFNQDDFIISSIQNCLAPVPKQLSSFQDPAGYCTTHARWELDDGKAKETLPGFVAKCVRAYKPATAESIIQTAEKCMNKALVTDPLPAALTEAKYSQTQLDLIGSRILSCLTDIKDSKYRTPAADCKNDAILQAGDAGYPKETLADYVTQCLVNKKKISATLANNAKPCLQKVLAEKV